MKRIITIALILLSLQGYSQVDKAIDTKIDAGIKKFIEVVGFDTVRLKTFTSAATLDTLYAPNNSCYIVELLVSGAKISGNRIVAVTNTSGVYSVRFIDLIPFQGASTTTKFNTSVINNKVVISIGGATGNYTYQKSRKNIQ